LVVLNRSYPPEPGVLAAPVAPVEERAAERMQRLFPAGIDSMNPGTQKTLEALESLRRTLSREARAAQGRAAEFAGELPEGASAVVLPELEGDLTSLAALRQLVGLVDA
ncbi:MAG: hypothetical protein JRH11_24460, partial [Deltaproteobacteria bacterium]|nr:hypothetical protein [Deltaproteobacteria bacterium]